MPFGRKKFCVFKSEKFGSPRNLLRRSRRNHAPIYRAATGVHVDDIAYVVDHIIKENSATAMRIRHWRTRYQNCDLVFNQLGVVFQKQVAS